MLCCILTVTAAVIVTYFILDYIIRLPKVGGYTEKCVFITGCDTGFGNLLAQRLDSLGFHVFAGCLTKVGAESLTKLCSSRLKTVILDVSDHESVLNAYKYVKDNLPNEKSLWAVVNNAGIPGIPGPMEWFTIQDYNKVLQVNLMGVIDVTHTFIPLLKASGGRLVNMASMMGRISAQHAIPYCVSKFGVESFTDGIRPQFGKYGVKVSMLEPGAFRTNITDTDKLTTGMRNKFESLPDDVKQQFSSKDVDRMGWFLTTFLYPNDNLLQVVSAYEHAITSKHPRKRYSVGLDSRYFAIPLSYLPSFCLDTVAWLESSAMGLIR